jgi:hypothetical protein
LLSVLMIIIPVLMLLVIIFIFTVRTVPQNKLLLAYGFLVLFGWITAVILGMTFKTLPFIIWNKVYRRSTGKTPNPKNLFSSPVFNAMGIAYISGLLLFVTGIIDSRLIVLKCGAALLLLAAALYSFNVFKLLTHKNSAA